ncbi:hypothetical protein F5876DRAFT_80145 [Lentinula aff. lateritia]|uniref:Uncharacterized protein n=1 Tax=Lentinula aff. lateritia TaxID=2804960 RepID=A0ACC1TQG8_9AGAR|nr:hypothetical protein F5876DRAFT_80145 [Lentinula aff. lateritia]
MSKSPLSCISGPQRVHSRLPACEGGALLPSTSTPMVRSPPTTTPGLGLPGASPRTRFPLANFHEAPRGAADLQSSHGAASSFVGLAGGNWDNVLHDAGQIASFLRGECAPDAHAIDWRRLSRGVVLSSVLSTFLLRPLTPPRPFTTPDYTHHVMLSGARCSSRQAMNRLSELFPLINSLKLNPAVVDVLAPRELQLQSIGFLRQFSPFDELNNLDPDFAALQQVFESGAARSTADAQDDDCVGHHHEEEDNSSLESSGEGSCERAVGTRCVVQISTQTPSSPALPNSKRKATSTSDQERPNAATKLRRVDPRSPLPPAVDPLPTGSTTATSRSVHLVWSATSGDSFHASSAFPPGFNPQSPKFQPVRPVHLSSPEWRRMRKCQHRKWSLSQRVNKSTEVHVSPGEFNIVEDSRISKPAWMGLKASADLRIPIQDSILKPNTESAALLFKDITLVPYVPHLALAVGDSLGRLFLYRSRLTTDMIKDLLPQVNAVVPKFVSAITKPFGQNDMLLNSRGEHWFSIAGHDRNNKSTPAATQFQQQNHLALTTLFQQGSVLQRLTAYGCEILKVHFPAIAKRYQDSINYMRLKYGIEAMFGLFFNFCLNAPRKGVKRVFCKPHVDWKNVAFGVCMIYVYGHFNHREKCWLVIWEAGIAIEIPPGVFMFYPSSLFLHFNVDLSHLRIFTTQNGERPTPDNSKPLYFCGCESHRETKVGLTLTVGAPWFGSTRHP